MRYSLRVLFAVTLGICLALAVFMGRIRRQDAVVAAAGGESKARLLILYDYQMEFARSSNPSLEPPLNPSDRYPKWLVAAVGRHAFITIQAVDFSTYPDPVSDELIRELEAISTLTHIRFGRSRMKREHVRRLIDAHPKIRILDAVLTYSD